MAIVFAFSIILPSLYHLWIIMIKIFGTMLSSHSDRQVSLLALKEGIQFHTTKHGN